MIDKANMYMIISWQGIIYLYHIYATFIYLYHTLTISLMKARISLPAFSEVCRIQVRSCPPLSVIAPSDMYLCRTISGCT
jgi:hypothetical protein